MNVNHEWVTPTDNLVLNTSHVLTIPPISIVLCGEGGKKLAWFDIDGGAHYADDLTLDEAKTALKFALEELARRELMK